MVGLGGDRRGEGAAGEPHLPRRGGRAEVEGQAVQGRRLSKDGEDQGEGREMELSGVRVGNQQMCLQEGKWEKEEGQGEGRGKGTVSHGEVGWSIQTVCQTAADVQQEYWSARRAKTHGKTNLFVRIVNRKLINRVAVCTACLPNCASASLVKPKKKYLFKMMIKCHFKSGIHLKLLKLSLNLGEQYWRGKAEVRASVTTWVFLWLICQTSF